MGSLMQKVRLMAIGGKPPLYLTDGKVRRVDRGRWLLPPGSLAWGVEAGSRIRVIQRVFSPPPDWQWIQQAESVLRVLRHHPPDEGPSLLSWLWDVWPNVQYDGFPILWEGLLSYMGTPLPPCRRCGGRMVKGGDSHRWICSACGGRDRGHHPLQIFVERHYGIRPVLLFPDLDQK